MKPESSSRELQRVNELANEYRNKGYEVVAPCTPAELPRFLGNSHYIPHLIVRSEHENLIIEVRSQESARDLGQLSEIAELVNAQENWQFVLVFTNPRESSAPLIQPSAEKARLLLAKSRAMGTEDEAHIEAAFLFAWAALEASLRLLPEVRGATKQPHMPLTFIRNATMSGYISRPDAYLLERLSKLRASLLHAGPEPSPQIRDLNNLCTVVEEVMHVIGVDAPNN